MAKFGPGNYPVDDRMVETSVRKTITIKVIDGKQDTLDESRVDYITGVPSDILFIWRKDIQYISFWNQRNECVEIPVSQVLSID